MDEPVLSSVVALKNPKGHDVILNVMQLHIFVDQLVFAGHDADVGHRIPVTPETGLLMPFRSGTEGQDFTGLAHLKDLRVTRMDEADRPQMVVQLQFWAPRAFEVFVDPDTNYTVVLDVTSAVER